MLIINHHHHQQQQLSGFGPSHIAPQLRQSISAALSRCSNMV